MISKGPIGLHLRLKDSFVQLIEDACDYPMPIFQFFLLRQKTGRYLPLTPSEQQAFVALRKKRFSTLYVHASYWINPSSGSKDAISSSRRLLKKELFQAKQLGVEYVILHAGSAKNFSPVLDLKECKKKGIASLAKVLNYVLKKENDVKILLENSAHGKRTVGNDMNDFVDILKELNAPEKVGFCVDTAHAFSYGYDVSRVDDFVAMLDSTVGLDRIKLIHFNDIEDARGSMLDRHAFPGQGKIGKPALRQLLNHPNLISIPKIIEGPVSSKQTAIQILQDLALW